MWKLRKSLFEKLNDDEIQIHDFERKSAKYISAFNPLKVSSRIAGIYFVIGSLWILLSDRLVSWLVSDTWLLMIISMIKGWFYVLISASLIYLLIFNSLNRIKKTEKRLLQSYQELSATHEELEAVYEEITASNDELEMKCDQLTVSQNLLIDSEERYRLVSEATNDAIWEESNGEILFSDRWFDIIGFSRAEIKNIGGWESLMHPEDKENPFTKLLEYKQLKTPLFSYEYRIRSKDGSYKWLLTRGKVLFDDTGKVYRMAGSQTDITELKNSQEKLSYLAYHDLLTGLLNKLSLIENSNRIFSSPENKIALLYIDMDNFKNINDTMGHAFGDQVIIEVSKRLTSMHTEKSSVYRLGGDEFIITIPNISELKDVEAYASDIIAAFKQRFEINDSLLNISLSIGVAVYPEHGSNFYDLLKCADIAMYRSKEQGKNRYVVYCDKMKEVFAQRMIIEKCLHSALERQEFEVYYQPQVDLRQNRITGFEALVRWNSPELGFVSPLQFIEIAEDTHLIISLGAWILKNACAFLKRLHLKGYKELIMSVNISILQLLQADFVDMVKHTLEALGMEPEHLELEITESILIENFDAVTKKLEILRNMGIGIALDDFGKGYSSLSYLKQLPISTLKIDKSFIDNISISSNEDTLTGHIIKIGKSMGMCVIAEGVEEREQLDYLMKLECNKVQGYLFSKPVNEEAAARLLEVQLS